MIAMMIVIMIKKIFFINKTIGKIENRSDW